MKTIIILALIFINGLTIGYYRKKLNDKNRKDFGKENCVHPYHLIKFHYNKGKVYCNKCHKYI